MKTIFKYFLTFLLISVLKQVVNAQKLPSEQKESIYAPVNAKADGKPTEWLGKFQAKNDATQLTYVMANDEENLYLTIQANQPQVVTKIFIGGIQLVIKNKRDKNSTPLKITYPLVQKADRMKVSAALKNKSANIDSVVTVANTAIGQTAKTIGLTGFANLSDPDISVYNDLGIKAAAKADNSRTMTFEYILPLKYLSNLTDANSSFDYEIVVPGFSTGLAAVPIAEDPGPKKLTDGTILVQGGPPPEYANATYLKATYKLAKK